jgi:hypothetical protein
MHKFALFMAVLIALLLVGYLSYLHYVKARSLLQAWADANGYKILHARRNSLLMPLGMYFSTSKYQVVYHVAVYDASVKRIRSAWVRLGTYWTGSMDGDAIQVKWEHEDEA